MRNLPRIAFALAVCCWAALSSLSLRGAEAEFSPEQIEFFEREVRPILANRCQECHGPNEQKGSLRLDSRSTILAGGDTGPAIEPGKPNDSLLVDAIRYGETYQMPPKSQLPREEIDVLERWVAMGAPWPAEEIAAKVASAGEFNLAERAKHWAYQPLTEVAPPQVQNEAWPRTALDRFILFELEKAGMSPAAEIDRRTWLRRVTFDLTGLPSTRAEIAAFLADESPTAYETVVERLLASPQYGERWARHWLDLARYAETHGHEFDFEIPNAWRYRDYVIRALNDDVPYDQFLREQVAGDLLANPRVNRAERWNESIMGTGFFLLGEAKHSPVDAKQDEAERVDNQIDVFAKTFLGLTVSCARCHDHKFDAIRTKDYYSLAGYLQSSRYQQAFIDLPEVFETSLTELDALRAVENEALASELRRQLDAHRESAFERLASDEELQAARQRASHPMHAYAVLANGKDFAAGKNQLAKTLASSAQSAATLFRLDETGYAEWTATGQAFGDAPARPGEVIVAIEGDRAMPRVVADFAAHSGQRSNKLQGVLRSPTFEIREPKLHYRLSGSGGRVRLILDGLQLIQEPIYGGLQFGPRSPEPHWHTQDVSKWVGHRAYIELIDDGDAFLSLAEVVSGGDAPPAEKPHAAAAELLNEPDLDSLEKLRSAYLQRFVAENRSALVGFAIAKLAVQADSRIDWNALAEKRRAIEARIPAPRQAPALADGTGENERVFVRGNHKNLGEEAPRQNLAVLSGLEQPAPEKGSGREQLAERLLTDGAPLVARVVVNRVWKHHFGAGLVASPDDFGVMGQPPTNPALLDFLAAEFMREGWSLKRLHRELTLSSLYRMSGERRAEYDTLDPLNQRWHRVPVRRLEAECIRDGMLAISGRLDPTLYGRSVPPHLTEFMVGRGRPAFSGPIDGAGRRSIYLNVRRNFLSPLLLAFDYPTPFTTIGRRSVSNVPAQALAMLNNPLVQKLAGSWAERVLSEPQLSDAERVALMYEEAFGRLPSDAETNSALEFLAAAKSEVSERDAWAGMGHVLMNVKEFIYVK